MIKITLEGDRASGKTILLNRIMRLMQQELGNYTMMIDDPLNSNGRGLDHHGATLTLSDEDRARLAAAPCPPVAVEIETADDAEPGVYITKNVLKTVGEVSTSESASLNLASLSDLRELHRAGELGNIINSMLTKES